MKHRVGGRVAGRVDGGHVHKPALPGPTCKLEPARSKRVGFQVGAECGNMIGKLKHTENLMKLQNTQVLVYNNKVYKNV